MNHNEFIDKYKNKFPITLFVFITGLFEEILKRRRRTTLALGAIATFVLYAYSTFCK